MADVVSKTAYIVSHDDLLVYRPADDVVCDKTAFGGDRKRVMALMNLEIHLNQIEDPDSDDEISVQQRDKMTWTLDPVPDTFDKFFIKSCSGEPLYRPADDVVCDKTDFGGKGSRLMALVKRGQCINDWDDKTKITWTLNLVPGSISKFYILSHKGEPLYRPADDVVCDKTEFGRRERRLMLLMKRGSKVVGFPGDKTRIEWKFKMLAGSLKSVIESQLTPRTIDVPPGMCAVWEWCRCAKIKEGDLDKLVDKDWGIYSKVQNSSIEAAFAAGYPETSVEVGVRKYTLYFPIRGLGFSKQKDEKWKTSRWVRRHLHPEADLDVSTGAPVGRTLPMDQDTCCLCFDLFNETSEMPIKELCCHHVFHTACLVPIRKGEESCPVCRTPVDWKKFKM